MYNRTCTQSVSNTSLINEYGKFLETINFTHYVTITTRYNLSARSARRLAERFAGQLSYNGVKPQMFWVAEEYCAKDGQHIHALVKLDGVDYKNGNARIKIAALNAVGGKKKFDSGNTVVEPYLKDKGANFYIGKQMHRPHTDYDFI